MANTTTSSLLAENPEQAEEKREADEAFRKAGEEADFGARAESLKISLGGIGQRAPEEASIVSGDVAQAEAQDPENKYPDDDLLSAFDTIGSETGILENENPSPEIGEEGEVIEAPSENIVPKQENEYTPLFTNFAETGKLTPEELTTVLQANITADNFNETIAKLDISGQAKAGITKSISYLNSEGHQKQARETITKDFPDMIDERFKNPKGTNELISSHAEVALNNLSRHFGGNEIDPAQNEADLHRAFQMASNAVGIKGGSLLTPQNELRFQENKKTLGNPQSSLKEKFSALVDNTELTSTEAGIKSISRTEMTQGDDNTPEDTQLTDMIEKAGLGAQFDTAQITLQSAQTSGDTQKIKATQEKVTQIVEQAVELTGTPLGNMVSTALEMGEVDAGQETSPQTA